MVSSLIDLNLYPHPVDNLKPIITPKIEPKSEPIDDMSHTPNPPIAIVVPHDDVADNNNAIVPVLDNHNQVADNNNGNGNMMTSSHRKSLRRSFELVRGVGGMEDDKRRAVINMGGGALGSHARGDLKAASVMNDRGLWLNRDKRIVGAIPGVHVGDVFFFRMELCAVGMHGQAHAGIDYLTSSQSSNGESIATSVIVSGGYEDVKDAGNMIVYTGHGGQDKHSRQVVHQRLEGGNLAMERSMHYGIEVRVIRGFKYEESASGKVYVYDGLYKIVEAWFVVGKSGFGVFKFKLVRIVNQVEIGSAELKFANTLRARPFRGLPCGYLATTVFPKFVYHLGVKGSRCSCVSRCTLDCLCPKKNGGVFAYDANGLLVRGKPLIFKCGPHCRCPPGCQNRVSQKGVRNRFEVFRSREMGWGVRSLDLIQAGSFICEYTRVVLTRDQAKLFTSTRSPVHDNS
ncbi:histone-lysine N-methyltransferase family member SUVH9-like protein [Tanacetum coccineum]